MKHFIARKIAKGEMPEIGYFIPPKCTDENWSKSNEIYSNVVMRKSGAREARKEPQQHLIKVRAIS